MAKKRQVVEEEEEDEVYHVEVITKARVSEEGDWEYLVKWAGYDSDADSWEPSENVKQCDRLLTSFWKHVGTDDEDYPIGYEIAAQEDWIKKEKRYFAETFVKPPKGRAEKERKERQERRKSKSSTSRRSDSSEDDVQSSGDEPSTRKRPMHKPLPVDTESESESDVPLRKQAKEHPRPKPTEAPSKEIAMASAHVSGKESLPTTGGARNAPLIAPPKVSAMRTHQDQKSNPLVKPMDIPSKSVEAGSLLSTKHRVAAGMLPPPSGPKPLQAIPKKSLSSLSFKKNKPPVPISIQAKDVKTSSTSVATPASPVAQHTGAAHDVHMVASPQPMDVDEPADFFAAISDDAGLSGGNVELPSAALPPKRQEETDAEKFLQTVNIPALSAPLESDSLLDQSDLQLSGSGKPSLIMPKIPKKWKWSGDLFISTSESKTELLCPVTIADPSGTSNSSYINLLLSSADSLRISRLYPVMDLSPIIRSCGKPQYFGRMDAGEPSEEVLIQGFNHHLTVEGLAAAIPLTLDGSEVAVLLVIPGAQKGLTKVLQFPEPLVNDTPLLVVLLPFLVSAMTATKAAGWGSLQTGLHSLAPTLHIMKTNHELSQEAFLTQAIAIMGFPRTLLDFLNSSPNSKTYCFWPLLDQSSQALDDVLLQLILKSTKAILAKVEEDVRVIFISNRHLERLCALPSLVSKRVNSPETQFWTYGFATNISSVNWRLKEVFPLGGIVTFTAAAIAEDLLGCHHLMSQIIDHPLWDCYLIPEVLAASYLLSGGGNLSLSSETCLDPILDLVDVGMLSVMKVPGHHSEREDWISQVFDHSGHAEHEVLAFYISALKGQPAISSMTDEQLITFTTHEVTMDLTKVQIQPTFMERYRRFIVIKSSTEEIAPFDKDGLEWCSLSTFHFKDDYFQA